MLHIARLSEANKRKITKVGGGLLLALIVALILWDFIALWNWEAFFEWKRQVGYIPFFVGLALLPLLGVPTTPLFVIAGATFTPVAALAGCGMSIAVNLALSHWLANRWMRRFVQRLMRQWEIEWPAHDERQALRFLLLFRLTPGIPTFIKNYATAMSEVSFRTYLGVSWVITFLYALGFVIMGDSLVNHSLGEALLGLAILVAGVFIIRYLRKNHLSGQKIGKVA